MDGREGESCMCVKAANLPLWCKEVIVGAFDYLYAIELRRVVFGGMRRAEATARDIASYDGAGSPRTCSIIEF